MNSILISLGGGTLGDLTGFVASTILRGISFRLIPTTLLSQVDSSIGGKTGVNTKQGKNLIGCFYHPKIVISDSEFLKSNNPSKYYNFEFYGHFNNDGYMLLSDLINSKLN